MIHLENGICNPEIFHYWRYPDKVPMAYTADERKRIEAYANQYSPLLLVFPDRLEIDWQFYANACSSEQQKMMQVLLAVGIFSLRRTENYRIALRKEPKKQVIALFGSELYFNHSRLHDARSYIQHSSRLCRISSHELTFVRKRAPGLPPPMPLPKPDPFDPNSLLNAEIVIMDKWPEPVH